MTSVCIASPAWGRIEVTRLVLEQRQRVCRDLASRGVDAGMLIAADDENLDVAGEYGCDTVETPNTPLGAKCNTLLYRAAETGVDYIVWVGSDDWIHPSVFDPIIGQGKLPARSKIHTGRHLSIVDMRTGMLSRLRVSGKYGAIPWVMDARMFRNAVTRRDGRRLAQIEPKEKRGLDGALIKGLRLGRVNFDWSFSDPSEFRCVDFKTRTNITPFAGLAKNVGIAEPEPAWDALAAEFPADLVQKAHDLSEAFQGVPE